MLRSSAGLASRPSRRSSSPADFPPVRSAPQTLRVTGRAVRSPGPARLRSSAFHCADSASAGSGRTRCVPAPSLRRPQPTFAFFCSSSFVRPVPLRLGADPSQAKDQPPGSASSRTSFVASAASSPLRSLPGNLPALRTACAGSGGAPLRQIPFQSAPLQRFARRACPGLRLLRATPGYSLRRLRQNPFRAHSAPPARTGAGSLWFRLQATCPFTPAGSWRSAGSTASLRRPLPGQIATPARFLPRSDQPARPLPSSAGAPLAAQPSCGVRSRAD